MANALNAAERMLRSKKKLIARLRAEIADAHKWANEEEKSITSRIKVAQTLVDALEKGTLKP